MTRALLLFAALFAALCCSAPTRADTLQPGYLELTQRDATHWTMIWKAPT